MAHTWPPCTWPVGTAVWAARRETRWTACRVGLMLVRMEFCLHADVESFWDAAGPLYEADPIRHTVALTVIGGMRAERRLSLRSTDDAGIAGDGEGSRSSGEPAEDVDGQNDGTNPLLVTIVDKGRTIGAAFCTPPYPIGVSGVPVECVPKLATFLRERGVRLSGVTGPSDVSNAFAHEWGLGTTEVMRMRCYRLDELEPPDVPGSMRLAGVEDIPQLQAFEREFFRETDMPMPGADHRRRILQSMTLGNAHGLWYEGDSVRAMARASAQLRGMSRVGLVYTPPEHRRRGYGAAITAAVSRWALDQGARDVVLFTDLANPTSNSIYQKIGYRPVYDGAEYRFPTTVA